MGNKLFINNKKKIYVCLKENKQKISLIINSFKTMPIFMQFNINHINIDINKIHNISLYVKNIYVAFKAFIKSKYKSRFKNASKFILRNVSYNVFSLSITNKIKILLKNIFSQNTKYNIESSNKIGLKNTFDSNYTINILTYNIVNLIETLKIDYSINFANIQESIVSIKNIISNIYNYKLSNISKFVFKDISHHQLSIIFFIKSILNLRQTYTQKFEYNFNTIDNLGINYHVFDYDNLMLSELDNRLIRDMEYNIE